MPATRGDRWWTDTVGYEVYVRSFQDSTGNGIGDLAGITSRLDHLAWLGIDVVWLTPHFTSPMVDFGYDVSDYTDVDPMFGTLADFDALVEQAHELGMRIVSDIIPNHSSNRHQWFEESRSSRDNPYRDYYIWRDPASDGGPPNNWLAHFGGSAWTLDEATGQYYCHLFLPEQPDLNWRNPAVREEFEKILRFWLDRGIDGFRIDVAQSLYKDEQFRDNPLLAPLEGVRNARELFSRMEHRYDLMQPESLDVFRRWREIAAEYDAVLIGETYVHRTDQLAALLRGDGLDVGFWFRPMHIEWSPDTVREALTAPLDGVNEAVGWVTSSHDACRSVHRFGGGDIGRRRSLGLTTLMFGLPGMPFLYQGEELGLDDPDLADDELADPLAVRNEATLGRDTCRTPMPWEPGPNLGFSTAVDTWLPVGHTEADTVAAQRGDGGSVLNRYRRLINLRRELSEHHRDEPVLWLDAEDGVLAFRRGEVVYALNAGDERRSLALGDAHEILFHTVGGESGPTPVLDLEPADAVVARRPR